MTEERKKNPSKRKRGTKGFADFRSGARSILWRAEPGKVRKSFDAWMERIKDLQDNSGMSEQQATITASKGYRSLHHLFGIHDVREHDLHPGSDPTIRHYGEVRSATVTPGEEAEVTILGEELSYRENLNWAMAAAGGNRHTGGDPPTCPNYKAWFLYVEAMDNPKEFLAKVGQVEARQDDGDDRCETIRSARRSISDLNDMLDALELQEETQDEAVRVHSEDVEDSANEGTQEEEAKE